MKLHHELKLSHKAIIIILSFIALFIFAGLTMIIIGAMDCSGYWSNFLGQESFSLDGAIVMIVLGVCLQPICITPFLNLLFYEFNHKEK